MRAERNISGAERRLEHRNLESSVRSSVYYSVEEESHPRYQPFMWDLFALETSAGAAVDARWRRRPLWRVFLWRGEILNSCPSQWWRLRFALSPQAVTTNGTFSGSRSTTAHLGELDLIRTRSFRTGNRRRTCSRTWDSVSMCILLSWALVSYLTLASSRAGLEKERGWCLLVCCCRPLFDGFSFVFVFHICLTLWNLFLRDLREHTSVVQERRSGLNPGPPRPV